MAKTSLSGGVATLTNQYLLGLDNEQVTELDGNGVWMHSNVYASGKMLATYDNVGLHFQFSDWLGSRRVQADGLGNTEETCSNLPYGDNLSCLSSGTDATEHHFTGKERDTESGLDYFGARYYSSSLGRFMSPDWSAKEEPVPYAKLDNPQSLNLYVYVGNNPLSRADADGHFPVLALAGGGLLADEAPLAAAGPVGWTVIGVTAVGVLGYAAYEHFHQDAPAPAATEEGKPPVVVVDGAKHPESAAHVAGAQAAGHPAVVTVDRPGAKGRRAAATSGTKTEPGKHRDEYPPAVTAEGGQGASVQNIGASDNTGSGASLGNQLRQYPNGTQVEIKPINVPKPL